jgi:hypothetical protein
MDQAANGVASLAVCSNPRPFLSVGIWTSDHRFQPWLFEYVTDTTPVVPLDSILMRIFSP